MKDKKKNETGAYERAVVDGEAREVAFLLVLSLEKLSQMKC